MRRWTVVAAVVILLAGGFAYGAVRLLSSAPASPARVPGYHAMPRPADATTVTVNFATRPAAGGKPAQPAVPAVPFAECAGAGRDCGELIQVSNSGWLIEADPGTGPYDGSAATLVGVVNSSGGTIGSLTITADTGVFAFAGDGACSGRFAFFRPAHGCPYGPTGYEGPGTSFTGIDGSGTTGTVTFGKPLAPGKTAWFSLAQALAAQVVADGGASAAEQGGAPNPAEHQAACSQQPVNCATGTLWQEFTDFSVPGRGVPLLLTRTYVSADAGTGSPFGYGWTDSYAMQLVPGPGGSETVVQEDGATVTFKPDSSGGYTAPARALALLTQNTGQNGEVTYTFFRYGSRVRYVFSATGQLMSETDANGNTTQLTYNSDETLHTVLDTSGRYLRFTYKNGHVWQVIDPMGRTETYGYSRGQLIWAKDDIGDMWHFGYKPGTNLLTSVEDPRGYTTKITYHGNRVSSVSEPGLGTTGWSYSGNAATPEGGTTTEHGPGEQGQQDGPVTTYDYRALELTAVTAGTGTADAATTGYTYTTGVDGTPSGLVASQTDPELNVTTYGYDGDGNLTSVTNPLGKTTQYTYAGNAEQWGEVTQVTMPGPGAPSESYQYNQQNGNLEQSTDGDGITTMYTYGETNDSDLTGISGPDGQSVQLGYDNSGDVTSEAIAAGSGTDTTLYAYNGDGQLTCEAPAVLAGQVSCPSAAWGTPPHQQGTEAFGYNPAGEQVTSTDAQGNTTTTTYDKDGNVSTVTTPDRVVARYKYNAADEEILQTAGKPGAQPTVVATLAYYPDGELDYEAAGPVQASTGSTPAGVTTDGYDILGRLTSVTGPLDDVTGYSYGRDGELASVTGPGGQVTSYTYNHAGEPTKVHYSDATTPSVSYAYNPDGLLRAMTDGTGTTIYDYDGDGALTAAREGTGSHGTAGYSYSYDAATGTGTLTYPNGQQVTDTYDQAGQLVKVTDWLRNTIAFKYAPGGALSQENFPGGIRVTDDEATAGDDLKVTGNGTTLASFTDDRDPEGRLSSVATTGIPGSPASTSYGYDAAGWLASAGQELLDYDSQGGLTTPPGGTMQQFNAAGELEPAKGASYAYNSEGDLTSATLPGGSPRQLSYNQAGELTSYQSGTATARYSYDGEGLLASRTVNGVATGYTWDLSQADPELLAAGSTSYIYGPDGQPVEQVTGATATFLVADQQGNTRLLTSKTGTVVGTYSYGPYGNATHSCPSGQPSQCATTALQYGGQYTDSATGDLYLDGRYYNPATGQFLTPAATANAQTPYEFAGDDPVNGQFTSLTWNPVAPSPGFWDKYGGYILGGTLLIIDLLTDDDDNAGASSGGAGEAIADDETVDEEAALDDGALAEEEAAATEEADTSSAGTMGIDADEAAAGSLTGEEADPVTESDALVDSESSADSVGPQQAPPSCWALPGAAVSCRALLLNTLKQVSVLGLITFLYKSIDAAHTCADPNKSSLQCASSALEALKSAAGIKKDNDE